VKPKWFGHAAAWLSRMMQFSMVDAPPTQSLQPWAGDAKVELGTMMAAAMAKSFLIFDLLWYHFLVALGAATWKVRAEFNNSESAVLTLHSGSSPAP
jgi:hypothetical protein